MTHVDFPTYQTYGRRKSRRWTSRHDALLESSHPLEAWEEVDFSNRQTVLGLFDKPVERVWLEIGFGYGEHLLGMAKENPTWGFMGAEVYLSGVAFATEAALKAGVENVRLCAQDGRWLLDQLPEGALDGIALLFPDPWPKSRHEKRQMFSPVFLANVRRLLKRGGILRFASDAGLYVAKVEAIMAHQEDFSLKAKHVTPDRPPLSHWPQTRYEAKALKKGAVCSYFEYILK